MLNHSSLNREIKYRGKISFEHVLDCVVQEIDNSLDALQIFTSDVPRNRLEYFDAHVGDTNCQTRAFMVPMLKKRYPLSTDMDDMIQLLKTKKNLVEEVRKKLEVDREVNIHFVTLSYFFRKRVMSPTLDLKRTEKVGTTHSQRKLIFCLG
jgi:hypothetical protein